jgi:hypothetical protein
MEATPIPTRRALLATSALGLTAIATAALAQSNPTGPSRVSNGGLFLPDARTAGQLSAAMVRERAYAMPAHAPAYAKPPSWFLDRPSLTISYRTDIESARAIVPEPLMVRDAIVSLAFLWMVAPGIGDYYVAQSISCFLGDEEVSFRPLMVAESVTAIMIGREVWDFQKSMAIHGSDKTTSHMSERLNTTALSSPARAWPTNSRSWIWKRPKGDLPFPASSSRSFLTSMARHRVSRSLFGSSTRT